MNKVLSIFVLISFIFTSCETEVDLFTDYKKTPVVFALLEPSEPIQYFRINPTFIGEGDAREVASDPSITNYGKGELDVKLIDVTLDGIEFQLKDSLGWIDLDEDGIFDVKNRIYYLETPIILESNGNITNTVLFPEHEYQLYIKNVNSGTVATSQITLGDINKVQMITPRRGISQFARDWMKFYSGTQYNGSYSFEFDADQLSERFLLEMRFYYTEGAEDKDSKARYLDMAIGELNDVDAFGGTKRISIDYDGEKFYQNLQSRLEPSQQRTGQTFDMNITVAGPDLETYISVQGATLSGLSQEAPSYSNIDNGLGIFSYRLKRTYSEFKIDQVSAQEVVNGNYTRDHFNCSRHGTQSDSQGVIACK